MKTLYDLVSRVLDSRDGYNDPINFRRAVRSAIWGADQVTQRHAWTNYHTESVHVANAPVEITASVDTAGLLTATVGTLPAWTDEGSILIGHRLYVVSVRHSSTTATLENYAGPAIASQEMRVVHDRLIVRDDVRQIYTVRNELDDIELLFVDPITFNDHQIRQNGEPSDPQIVTVTRTSHDGNRKTELRMSPPPSLAIAIRVSYYRLARKATTVHDCGEVTIASGDLDLAIITKPIHVSSSFDLQLVLSENAIAPDANLGFSVSDANPSVATLPVTSIATTTTLNLAANHTAVAGVGGILTQLLDLPPHTSEAAAMYAEAKYMQVGAGSYGDYWQTVKMADAELITAMEQEATLSRRSPSGRRQPVYTRPVVLVASNP
jgi:hypothetical protein